MEFRDLKKQYSVLKNEIDAAMVSVAAAGTYIGGNPVKELEEALAGYVGVNRCVSCANGTDALTLALKVWGIGPGDAVFVPDFTFFSSAEVVSAEGAEPVFVEVCPDTFNIDVADLENRILSVEAEGRLKAKVIVAVDLFGLPADYPAIREIADRHGLLVLEDGAQGFGGAIKGKKACSFGDIATTSFFPAKPLGCYGDGGALFTDNREWADLACSYKVHGKGSFKYDNVRIGMNSRLDTLQAAILSVKFKAFRDYELDSVNKVAVMYDTQLASCPLVCPSVPQNFLSSWAQYTVRLDSQERRDALQAHLKSKGIPSMVYYPTGMHAQTAFRYLASEENKYPVSEQLCKTVLSLPMHPYMTEDDVKTVADEIKSFFRNIQ